MIVQDFDCTGSIFITGELLQPYFYLSNLKPEDTLRKATRSTPPAKAVKKPAETEGLKRQNGWLRLGRRGFGGVKLSIGRRRPD